MVGRYGVSWGDRSETSRADVTPVCYVLHRILLFSPSLVALLYGVIQTLGKLKMSGSSSTKVLIENKNKWRIFLSQNLLLSVGRRKSAVAKVAFVTGTGKLIINDKDAFHYLQQNALSMAVIQAPLKTVSFEKKYNIVIKVQGGGLQAQAEAIQLGIARALCSTANTFRPPLKEKGFLRRDPREKERKKYGLKKARKAEQYSKR